MACNELLIHELTVGLPVWDEIKTSFVPEYKINYIIKHTVSSNDDLGDVGVSRRTFQ